MEMVSAYSDIFELTIMTTWIELSLMKLQYSFHLQDDFPPSCISNFKSYFKP